MSNRLVAGRYRLIREIGRGGMATVYLAEDGKHQREVALKALRPDLAAAVGPERFLREIEITAGLNHPHILPLLDSGDEDGLLFYVMPHVAGGSLRLLANAGPIPLEATARIAREVAAALDYAHARGVIHRDVKPENILFNEGLAVVSDFGIARAMSGLTRMTGTGLAVGTLGYMSPEQALATQELDSRSDVYSLGCVTYELITGATPASWPGPEDVELGRFSDLPEGHRRRLDGCPGRVEQVLVRALALRPQHRFDTPGGLAAALSAATERTEPFRDDQVRRLLRRAAELQAESTEAPGPGDLTIGHVEQIAAQVGIPPVHVREAAEELMRVEPPGSLPGPAVPGGAVPGTGMAEDVVPSERVAAQMERDWLALRDGKNRLVVRETVDGEVPESAFPTMVARIQRSLGMVGHASVGAGTLTWVPTEGVGEARHVVVHVAVSEGQTRIHIHEDLGLTGGGKLVPVVGGVFGAAFGGVVSDALAVSDPGSGVLILVLAAVGLLAARWAGTEIEGADRGPALRRLADALVGIARGALALPGTDRTGTGEP